MAKFVRKPYSDQDLKRLRAEYPDRSIALNDLAASMGRTRAAICSQAEVMGLSRDIRSSRDALIDAVVAEYATKTAAEIAAARGVKEATVRMWLRESRYGLEARGVAA